MAKQTSVAALLGTAATTLLNTAPAQALDLDFDLGGEAWDARAALMIYAESDDRVAAIAPAVELVRTIDTDESLSLRLTLDSLTGASPNGAVASNSAQTFTGPSGNGAYTTPAGEIPLDDTFKDTRVSLGASWLRPAGENGEMTLGANLSNEYDYIAASVSALYAHSLNTNNTTLSAGLSLGSDQIKPVGGTPTAFAALPIASGHDEDDDDDDDYDDVPQYRDGGSRSGSADESKALVDLLFGVTQVIDANSVLQLNLGLGLSDGYLNDPYKVISVVDANGDPVVLDAATNTTTALYENRPDSRSKRTFFAQYKREIGGDVLDSSYRFLSDDWGVQSHTVDLRFRFNPDQPGGLWWQPRLRYYTQSAADFYTPWLREGEQPTAGDSETHASADYRLGDMVTTTVGVAIGADSKRPWSLSLELYRQTPEEPGGKFGSLTGLTLAPEMEAVVLRYSVDL